VKYTFDLGPAGVWDVVHQSLAVATMDGAEHSGGERSCRRLNEMHASKGDHLVVDSRKVGSQPREGEIIEIHGQDGAPPYVVRWTDGHEGVTYPGPDAHVLPAK
jgi:hypothetical protein